MYLPFTEIMNYALEQLSDVEVDGLPEFKSHITFVPSDARVKSNRYSPGSFFGPDIVVMSIQDAYQFYQLDQTDEPTPSEFITKIKGQKPSGSIDWNILLSAVEIKRGSREEWSKAGESSHQEGENIPGWDADLRLCERLVDSRITTSTCKINLFL